MESQKKIPMQWVMIIGLITLLGLGGCAKKNVIANTSGAESGEAPGKGKTVTGSRSGPGGGTMGPADTQSNEDRTGLGTPSESPTTRGEAGMKAGGESGRATESLGPIGTGPLQGFSKGAGEERLGDSPPLMIAKAEPQDADLRKSRERRRELADIYFAFDKWVLSSEGKKNLMESAEFLKQNPNTKVVIEGYCDERGSREYNLVLGEKRAKETRRFLADLGIHNPVSVTSFGKERQVCNERDEACYWKNRRAHLLVDAGQ